MPVRPEAVEGPLAGHHLRLAGGACGLGRRELRADAPRHLGHLGPEQVQPLHREPEHRPGHADGAAHVARRVHHRGAAAAHAGHDLLVVDAPAACGREAQLRLQAAAVGDAARRDGGQRQLAHQRVAFVGRQRGEDGLALARAVQRLALAQRAIAALAVRAVVALQRHHLVAIARGEVDGLAGHVAQRAQLGAGGRHQVGHRIRALGVLEAAQAQAVDAPQRVAPQQAALHQRAEQAVQRGAWQRELAGQLGLAQAGGCAAHGVEHVERLLERGGAFGGGGHGGGHGPRGWNGGCGGHCTRLEVAAGRA
jgi:hypothetical protein